MRLLSTMKTDRSLCRIVRTIRRRKWLTFFSVTTVGGAAAAINISVQLKGKSWHQCIAQVFCESGPAAASIQRSNFESLAAQLKDTRSLPVRIFRDLNCVLRMGWMYRKAQKDDVPLSSIHERGAELLAEVCRKNGGIYIKIGQMVGVLEHIVPLEYTRAMQTMFSDSPRSGVDEIRVTVEYELGRPIEEVFATFDDEPIASASLAQVHIATLAATGQKVAVKVQHPTVQASAQVDLATISGLARATRFFFPRVDYVWLAEEAQRNLPLELDFHKEMENSQTLHKILAHRNDVVVPKVFSELSSKRVIVMSYEEGVSPTNHEGIAAMGLSNASVAAVIGDVFCEKIFVHGIVHGDPHPGNLLVRRMPPPVSQCHSSTVKDAPGSIVALTSSWCWWWNAIKIPTTWLLHVIRWKLCGTPAARPQLVILDHGLYRMLTPEIRVAYAGFWKAVLMGDEISMREHAVVLGAGDLFPLVASILTRKSYDKVLQRNNVNNHDLPPNLIITGTSQEKEALQNNVQQYLFDINNLFKQCNSDVLLLFKTHDCLMHTYSSLEAPMTGLACTAKYVDRVILPTAKFYTFQTQVGVRSMTQWGAWLKYKIVTTWIHMAALLGM
eukprot:m.635872 g.635872  ORF g.635872 m.635872 type:complete len:612 (+) comp22587_c0_seq20:529-2364(+)